MATAIVPFDVVDVPNLTNEAIDLLASLEEGKAVRVPFGERGPQLLRQSFYQRARRLGIAISTRTEEASLLVFRARERRPNRRSAARSERDSEVRLAIDAMESYRDIAKRFGVSRQRIEQIALSGRREDISFVRGVSPENRTAALRSFLQPYIEVAVKVTTCPLCGGPATLTKTASAVCKRCVRAIRILRVAKSLLRSVANNGHPHSATQAKWTIMRYGIKPEDLELI